MGTVNDFISQESEEFLEYCILWMVLRGDDADIATGAKNGGGFLTVPWSPQGHLRELNYDTLKNEQFEEYRQASQSAYEKWRIYHDNNKDDDAHVEKFDFSIFPYQGNDGLDLYSYLVDKPLGYNHQLKGKATDLGFYTHYEDIPISCPLIRHFMTRMLQFTKTRTFGMRNNQRFNLWRKMRKLLLDEPIYLCDAGMDYIATDEGQYWLSLCPVQRFQVLRLSVKLAMEESTNLAEHLNNVLQSDVTYTLSSLEPDFTPLRPLLETQGYSMWFVYWDGPSKYILFRRNFGGRLEIMANSNGPEISEINTDGFEFVEFIETLSEFIRVFEKKARRRASRDHRNNVYTLEQLPTRKRQYWLRSEPIELNQVGLNVSREERMRQRARRKKVRDEEEVTEV